MLKKAIQLLLLFLISSTICFSQQKSVSKNTFGATLPFTFVDIAGPRPVIEYFINDKKATSMIHSNASPYLQLSPENAKYFGVKDLVEDGQFGISEPGKVNTRYKGVIQKIRMGNLIQNNAEVSVFNKYPPDKEGFGMLGRKWIKENKIILDYGNNRVAILPNKFQQDLIAKQLLKDNYISIPMQLDEKDNSYYTEVFVNNQKTKFLVSTVTKLLIDSALAKAANIETGESLGSFGGPTGKTGYVYSSKEKFTLKIGAFETATNGAIEDTYKYSNIKRPADVSEWVGGTLGATFMIEHKAVIDFGNLKLYLK
jgi:hypothetical protein